MSEPSAYVWLYAQVFGTNDDPEILTGARCEKLIAWRLQPGAT